MCKRRLKVRLLLVLVASSLAGLGGCATAIPEGKLGVSDIRRIIIVGENVQPAIAQYYAKKYEAQVWFTPRESGAVAHAADNLFQSGFGASADQRRLIGDLKSINYTVGRWEIIVPQVAEKYFLTALKRMPKASMSKARGMVVLTESSGHPDMEKEVLRVTGGTFFVTYKLYEE